MAIRLALFLSRVFDRTSLRTVECISIRPALNAKRTELFRDGANVEAHGQRFNLVWKFLLNKQKQNLSLCVAVLTQNVLSQQGPSIGGSVNRFFRNQLRELQE